MTDNEIVKALECCLDISPSTCKNCSLFNVTNSTMVCSKIATKFALDLINRQKAEIERLKAEADMADGYEDAICERARTEAKKEFAEKLIYKIVNTPTKFESTYYMYREGIAFRQNEIIDIIKEMVGEG